MWALDVVAAHLLVRAPVGDVEHLLVRRKRQTVWLVEGVGHDREAVRGGVVAVDVVSDLRLGLEPLEVPVARIGEPCGSPIRATGTSRGSSPSRRSETTSTATTPPRTASRSWPTPSTSQTVWRFRRTSRCSTSPTGARTRRWAATTSSAHIT